MILIMMICLLMIMSVLKVKMEMTIMSPYVKIIYLPSVKRRIQRQVNRVIEVSIMKRDMKEKINLVTMNMKLKKVITTIDLVIAMIRKNVVIILIFQIVTLMILLL